LGLERLCVSVPYGQKPEHFPKFRIGYSGFFVFPARCQIPNRIEVGPELFWRLIFPGIFPAGISPQRIFCQTRIFSENPGSIFRQKGKLPKAKFREKINPLNAKSSLLVKSFGAII
jgi:hypothetical protein